MLDKFQNLCENVHFWQLESHCNYGKLCSNTNMNVEKFKLTCHYLKFQSLIGANDF
jgi:hypothetical protein